MKMRLVQTKAPLQKIVFVIAYLHSLVCMCACYNVSSFMQNVAVKELRLFAEDKRHRIVPTKRELLLFVFMLPKCFQCFDV